MKSLNFRSLLWFSISEFTYSSNAEFEHSICFFHPTILKKYNFPSIEVTAHFIWILGSFGVNELVKRDIPLATTRIEPIRTQ